MKRHDPFASSAVALIAQFLIQVIVGIVLHTRYSPTLDGAHASVQAMRDDRLFAILQNLHYWGSALLIIHSFVHLAAMVWAGRYRSPYRAELVGTLVLFGASFLFQITGNLLPMDRHDVQTVAIEAGIAGSIPAVGPSIREAMLQGSSFGQPTLDAWLNVHRYGLPALSVIGFLLILAGQGRRNESARAVWLLAPVGVLAALSTLVAAPAGQAAVAADYAEQAARVSWYTWPMHGALKTFAAISPTWGWIGATVLPGLFGLFLMWLLIRGEKASPVVAKLGFVGFVFVFVGMAVLFGGGFAPLVGNQDPPVMAAVESGDVLTPIDEALAAKGHTLFNELPCAGCHGQDGVGGGAPDLSRIFEKYRNAEWYIEFIRAPESVKPGSTMPGFADLEDSQLAALAEYLRRPR